MEGDLWRVAPARAAELAVEEVHRSDKFTENGKAEIAVRLLNVLRNWQPALKIRCPEECTPLSKQELKALGLRGNVKMDRAFWDALSQHGRVDPVAAAEVVYHRAHAAISVEGVIASARSSGIRKCTFYAGGSRACGHSLGLDRKVIDVGILEKWPPPECDAPWCSCAFALNIL